MTNTKSAVFGIVLAIVLFGPAACLQSPDCSRKDVFCAALVTDTLGIEDHGLNQDTWLGMTQAKDAGLLDRIAYIETVDPRDGEKNILKFAKDGYDVIFTVGMGLRKETVHYADLYPDSVFIGINQSDDESRPNLISVVFSEDQAGFLAGALAARLTETRVIGAACETSSLDSMWRYCEGFRAGAQFMDEKVKVFVKYRDGGSSEKLFIDGEWGGKTAEEMIQQGADVIFGAGGATGQGALIAAAREDVYAVGAEKDQGSVLTEASQKIVTSFYGRASLQILEMMRRIKSGEKVNGNVPGVIGLSSYNPNIQISDEIKGEIDQLLAGLSAGTIKTGIPVQVP